jgi:hypothetical protein
VIKDQTDRALWEVKNVIDCVPDELWSREYCEMPLFKHIYHMLHSLDLWYINPNDPSYREPDIHIVSLNDLDVKTGRFITRTEINYYYMAVKNKITAYTNFLTDGMLNERPVDCSYSKFELILAQFRHLHTHMGMIMGFIIEATGQWPTVLGLEKPIPEGNEYNKFC